MHQQLPPESSSPRRRPRGSCCDSRPCPPPASPGRDAPFCASSACCSYSPCSGPEPHAHGAHAELPVQHQLWRVGPLSSDAALQHVRHPGLPRLFHVLLLQFLQCVQPALLRLPLRTLALGRAAPAAGRRWPLHTLGCSPSFPTPHTRTAPPPPAEGALAETPNFIPDPENKGAASKCSNAAVAPRKPISGPRLAWQYDNLVGPNDNCYRLGWEAGNGWSFSVFGACARVGSAPAGAPSACACWAGSHLDPPPSHAKPPPPSLPAPPCAPPFSPGQMP